jgi:ABC-type Zn2+ transport system substrate-binding protein/surface adhesin
LNSVLLLYEYEYEDEDEDEDEEDEDEDEDEDEEDEDEDEEEGNKKLRKTIYFSKYYNYSSFPNRGDMQVHMKRRKQNLRFT